MDYALLKQLCEIRIPGREDEIRRVTATALKAVVDDIRVIAWQCHRSEEGQWRSSCYAGRSHG